jgi:hypothetical protein
VAEVFVSYSRSDQARVAPLVTAIDAKGWTALRGDPRLQATVAAAETRLAAPK